MKVLKFGGTSLADAQRMKNVAAIVGGLIGQGNGSASKVIVVLSAIAGTTDSLVKIVENTKHNEKSNSEKLIKLLLNHYKKYISELYIEQATSEFALAYVQSQFDNILEAIEQRFVPALEFNILAKGELISTKLFQLLLEEKKLESELLCSLDFLRLGQNGTPDTSFLESQLANLMSNYNARNVFVTQGFICRNAFGDVSNLKRGGSDYSASLIAAALSCEEVQIWTDIDGMHNNDPRFVDNTQAIRELSFDEAAELAYFGAKILHPASIKPARKKNIPVRLLNTLEPEAKGTLISSKSIEARIKAIAAKDGITAIKIRSSEMLQAPGFLRRVFEVFELYHTSIDMITTSEVAVSVTIDDTSYLDVITKTLKEFGHVEVDKNLTIICVVGEFLEQSTGIGIASNKVSGRHTN